MRVLFFGMFSEFSVSPLRRLIESGIEVCEVVVPAFKKAEGGRRKAEGSNFILQPSAFFLPVLPSPVSTNVVYLAQAHGIPVVEVEELSAPETLAALVAHQPDAICVACFPQIFPRTLLELPPLGCLNSHPSLLPGYRGPAPIFWQFRNGETRTGVTAHFMDEGADTGDIALQRAVNFPDGLSAAEADRLTSSAGAELMVEALRLLQRGREACPRQKQPESGASYFPSPARADFDIPTEWSARRAFNFMRGTEAWGVPFQIHAGQERITARHAVAFAPDGRLGAAWRPEGDEMWIQFSPGVLRIES